MEKSELETALKRCFPNSQHNKQKTAIKSYSLLNTPKENGNRSNSNVLRGQHLFCLSGNIGDFSFGSIAPDQFVYIRNALLNWKKYKRIDDELVEIDNFDDDQILLSSLLMNAEPDRSTLHPLPKPFLILAGISGTGKSRWVREQAKASCNGRFDANGRPINFEMVPVRPDWHEPSDLLGYVSRISGKPEYVPTDFLKFMVQAWLALPEAKLNPTEKDLTDVMPYWLCLDEMNLAPVEQYFADYLSILETRVWENQKYKCDPILKASLFKDFGTQELEQFFGSIGLVVKDEAGVIFPDEKCEAFIKLFTEHGIPLPPNLIVAGTVNMDETTHQFSRKVIDRAMTLDFGTFFPNDYDEFITGLQSRPKALTFGTCSHAVIHDESGAPQGLSDAMKKSAEFLKNVNEVLKGSPFELAYRALNELLVMVRTLLADDASNLPAIWDDFLMMKVLPRLEGDEDKLQRQNENLLEQLQATLDKEFVGVKTRPDLLRDGFENAVVEIPLRAPAKLAWMNARLKQNGYTSFWP